MEAMTERELVELVGYVKQNYGIDLSKKKSLIVGRLINYLSQNGFTSFAEYFRYVLVDSTGKAGMILVNKLTTNHTCFMREAKHFELFQSEVLPYLAKVEARSKDLRIWSAGCSSGEEAYTLALYLDTYFGPEKGLWDSKILATDISTAVLDQAQQGIYPNSQLDVLPRNWQDKYFTKLADDRSVIIDRIKREVIFRRFNLMSETLPFKKKFHVIFCRNVMIYFDAETRNKLVNRFYQHTEKGGFLFIGHSESLDRSETQYKAVASAVYRKE